MENANKFNENSSYTHIYTQSMKMNNGKCSLFCVRWHLVLSCSSNHKSDYIIPGNILCLCSFFILCGCRSVFYPSNGFCGIFKTARISQRKRWCFLFLYLPHDSRQLHICITFQKCYLIKSHKMKENRNAREMKIHGENVHLILFVCWIRATEKSICINQNKKK